MPAIAIIAAMNQDRVVGFQNQLPWRIPADLQRFRALTTGHRIVMGRKTFESIGKPLPHRENVVVSRTMPAQAGIRVVRSLEEAFAPIEVGSQMNPSLIFMIGGGELYAQTLAQSAPKVQNIFLTEVLKPCAGDAWFPEVDWRDWRLTHRAELRNPDDAALDAGLRFTFQDWERTRL